MKKVGEYTYFEDGWEAMNYPPGVAENLRMRSHAMIALRDIIEGRKLTQARAAKLLGVSQPRISALMNGHIEKFSLDALVEMLSRAGYTVRLSIQVAA
jgi:predicted XRE-type DNA-binding protein